MKKILFSLTLLGAVEVSHCSDDLLVISIFTGGGLIPLGAGMAFLGTTQHEPGLVFGGTGVMLLGGAAGLASYASVMAGHNFGKYQSSPLLWQNSPAPIRNEWKRLKMDFELMDQP